MQDSHLLACAETGLVPSPRAAAPAGASAEPTARAAGLCAQINPRLSTSPLRGEWTPVKMGPGSAADIWDTGRALPSARYCLDRAFLHLFPRSSSVLQDCGARCYQR